MKYIKRRYRVDLCVPEGLEIWHRSYDDLGGLVGVGVIFGLSVYCGHVALVGFCVKGRSGPPRHLK